jgi:hypothetical protein
MSAGGLSLVPQFGTLTDGCYDVVCVWERPGVDTISAWLRDLKLDTKAVILIYLARLSSAQRRNLRRMTRQRDFALLALDESLLLFLAGERDNRLRPFMECALPYAHVNPFTPFQAGNVPPEMFYGRGTMITELMRPEGSCIVYGGRQLGKSALLRTVQRKFTDPQKGNVAQVIDIKLIGDSRAGVGTEVLWLKLRDVLKESGVLPKTLNTDKPAEIERHIRDAMNTHKGCRFLILFDEADNFLDADSKLNFPVVTAMRDLMSSGERRFKVVFAGLHNVQRFQGIPNQPLAHFGSPILVGPLEPDAAFELVREPFHRMGYEFDATGSIFRILSYTNYHPGLIQYFCQALLKRLQSDVESDPPYMIRQGDVEAVYRDRPVQDSIRERLDWTLALDDRYRAIAWSLVVDQMQTRDGYTRAYTARELLGIVCDNWSAGFESLRVDDLRGLLEEMCGLGILIRNAEGNYRLRSPNLVHLMGSEDAIQDRLLELSEQQPPAVFDFDNHHALIDEHRVRHSPFSHAQERRLASPKYGVGLVFASDALGMGGMVEAVTSFVRGPDLSMTRGHAEEIPRQLTDAQDIRVWLQDYLKRHESQARLVVYQKVTGPSEAILQLIDTAHQFCRSRVHSQRVWLRVILLFGPEETWKWLSIPRDRREPVEDQVDAALAPNRWNGIGIRQRLEAQDKMSVEAVVGVALEATGGWPFLLDELFDRAGKADDVRPAAAAISQELVDPTSPLRTRFCAALGLEHLPYAETLLRQFHEYGTVPEQEFGVRLFDLPEGASTDDSMTTLEALQRLGCIESRRGGMLAVENVVARTLCGSV